MTDPRHLPAALDRRALLLGGVGVAGAVTASTLLEFAPAEAGSTTTKTFHGRFSTPDTPDWHYLPFTMPKGVRSLHVSYTSHPTDSGFGFSYNVVDIGVFDASGKGLGNAAGFRGWSGGARSEFTIGRHSATPGYLAGAMTPGRWHVILGPFLITPPGTPWKVTVSMRHGDPEEPAFQAHHAPTSVPGTGPGWYRGDLHLHSVYSDGSWTPKQLVAQARANGLDFMGTSDHNTNAATRVFGRYVPDGFLVVSGEEVTTRNGHWLATGTTPGTWVDWRYVKDDNKLRRFAHLTRTKGGVAIAAHPMVPVPGTRWDFSHAYSHMDAFEAWNGPWSPYNQLTVMRWQGQLAGGRYVPVVGNSDSHHSGQVVGLPQTVYRADSLSTAAIMDAVRGGHCWIAESSAVDLTFTASGTSTTTVIGLGDTAALTPGEQLVCDLDVTGVPGCLAQLLGRTGVLGFATADASGRITLKQAVDAAQGFVRAEVRRPVGAVADPMTYQGSAPMVALTNPIFSGYQWGPAAITRG